VSLESSSARARNNVNSRARAAGVRGRRAVTRRQVAGAVGVVLTAWGVLTALLMLGGEGIKHSSTVTAMDQRVTAFVVAHRTPALDQLMKIVTWAGSWVALFGVAVVVAVFAWRRILPILAVIAVLVAWWGELLAVTLTKAVVRRPRPPEALRVVAAHGWAFPSGHTANATVVFAAGAGLLTILVSKRNWRVLAWVLAVLATALVGFSRIELGVHWTTDVGASLIWTTCWLLTLIRILRGTAPRQLAKERG
jgi:membrane-associated phospholipid phosphatase